MLVKSELHGARDVLIMVEDSGRGIDPNDMDRIFDAFFTTKSYGMGLGLSICQSIIESHGGRLWASTRIPHGAVFYIQLPSGRIGRPMKTPEREEQPVVFVIDDDESLRDALRPAPQSAHASGR